MTTTPDTLDLTEVDADLDQVRRNVGHGEAQYNPDALTALAVAEKLRAEVERLREANANLIRNAEILADEIVSGTQPVVSW